MRKFIVHTRVLPSACCKIITDAPAVVEVEGEIITPMEDSSVGWLPQGEFKFRITQPQFLCETQEIRKADGTRGKVMVPPIYYSHTVYDQAHQAHVAAESIVRHNFKFEQRKTGKDFSEEEVQAKLTEIQEIFL